MRVQSIIIILLGKCCWQYGAE